MPRISDWLPHAVVFLYRTEEEAKRRARIGGSGFIVTQWIPGSAEIAGRPLAIPYAVSNRHVVFNGGASVISINRRDGAAPDVIALEPTDWVEHPGGDDVVATCLFQLTQPDTHLTSHIGADNLLTREGAAKFQVGIGDDVFMIGRFVNHQGRATNQPATRFGTISMGIEDIWVNELNRWQESYAVEMRSRTGFSGSPVAVYRTPTSVLTPDIPENLSSFWGLLGINWGYILDEDGENTWLNGVVPAWKILEVLDVPKLKKRQEEVVAEFHERFAPGGSTTAFASDEQSSAEGESPTHKEDFKRLLNEAARKREPKD